MDDFLKSNRELWNAWTGIHQKSKFYDVAGFRAGQLRLDKIEREIGDVRGKSLLHLQCHFGMTTLSWARLGASVTGADFSDQAIALARQLSAETGIAADFICSNLYALPQNLAGEFDFVFTSHGVLSWLPDLNAWARVIAHFLKRGGIFYLVEAHPFAYVFDDEHPAELRVRYPYSSAEPMRFETRGSYADPTADYRGVEYSWAHGLGDIVSALIAAGLRIDFIREYPFVSWKMLAFMEQDAEGWWRLPEKFPAMPLMFALKATKA